MQEDVSLPNALLFIKQCGTFTESRHRRAVVDIIPKIVCFFSAMYTEYCKVCIKPHVTLLKGRST